MSANLTLDPVSTALAAVQAQSVVTSAKPVSAAPVSSGSALSPALANPRLTVDPSVNRVVLEFFNSSGAITNTIPSQKQLEAYRLAAVAATPYDRDTGLAA